MNYSNKTSKILLVVLRNNRLVLNPNNERNITTDSNIQNLIDNEFIPYFITDPNGIITYASTKFCKLSKFSLDELIGETPRILKTEIHDGAFYKNLWDTINDGKIWVGEFKNKAKDGTFFWQKCAIIPLRDKRGNIESFLTIRFESTLEKDLEEELSSMQKMKVIGELSSHLAHDIRNPLGIITNEMELLKPELEQSEEKRKSYERVQRAIRRINHQITDILNFVKKQPQKMACVDLSEIISLAINNIVIPDNIKVNHTKNSISVTCDPYHVETLFVNLILNGINAISGNGEINISMIEQDNDVIIEVQDSGNGIPTETFERIFDPLFTTRQFGTGLGLAICKNIVEMHRGKISAKNNPTTFTVQLPKSPKPFFHQT